MSFPWEPPSLETLSSGSSLDLLSKSAGCWGLPLPSSVGSSSTLFILDPLFPEALNSSFLFTPGFGETYLLVVF